MKLTILILAVSISMTSAAAAQKSKKPPAPKKPAPQKPVAATSTPRVIGSTVFIVTKNGDRISGQLVDLTAYSVRLRSDNLDSTIALDTISQLSFGAPASGSDRVRQSQARAEFLRDSDATLSQFNSMASSLKSGIDYTEYGLKLSELRRSAERFITKYSAAENPTEARVLSLVAGALTDYAWARTIWTLKFGRSSDGTVNEGDSPLLEDALALYPDLLASAASGNKLSVEKLVAGLWRNAADKIDRARSLTAPAR